MILGRFSPQLLSHFVSTTKLSFVLFGFFSLDCFRIYSSVGSNFLRLMVNIFLPVKNLHLSQSYGSLH